MDQDTNEPMFDTKESVWAPETSKTRALSELTARVRALEKDLHVMKMKLNRRDASRAATK
jgi:uncharacterized small protein (DUF1192 family)